MLAQQRHSLNVDAGKKTEKNMVDAMARTKAACEGSLFYLDTDKR